MRVDASSRKTFVFNLYLQKGLALQKDNLIKNQESKLVISHQKNWKRSCFAWLKQESEKVSFYVQISSIDSVERSGWQGQTKKRKRQICQQQNGRRKYSNAYPPSLKQAEDIRKASNDLFFCILH